MAKTIQMRVVIVCFLLVFGLFNSCIEPYKVEIDSSKVYLVVDGLLTDEPGKHYVQLSTSTPFYDTKAFTNASVRGASVVIVDERGNEEPLQEESIGKYATTTPGYKGEIGRSYKIKITTKEGRSYESVAEEMKAVPEIANFRYEYREGPFESNSGFYTYVQVDDPAGEKNFYKWSYLGHQSEIHFYEDPMDPANGEEAYECITYETCSSCISVFSDKFTNGNKIEQLVAIVPYNKTARYVIKIDQYSISQRVYEFWESVQKQTQNTGGVFDVPPTGIKGNVYNIDNKEDIVLGYFGVSAKVSRAFTILRTGVKSPPKSPTLLPDGRPRRCTKIPQDCRPPIVPNPPPCDKPIPEYWYE